MLKTRCIWKIEILREELVDEYQTVPRQPGVLLWVLEGEGVLGQQSGSVPSSCPNPFHSYSDETPP